MIIAIIGIAGGIAVVMASGLMMIEIPTEKIVSDYTSPIQENNCDSSYPDVCIPSYPPDLDCVDVQFSSFRALQPDEHGFDIDKNGIGCES
jgi:micrococcal nuclease